LAVLDAIKNAKLKTLRVFISHTLQNNKDTGSVEMPDIEPQEVGTYDDSQLRAIDQLMIEAHDRGESSAAQHILSSMLTVQVSNLSLLRMIATSWVAGEMVLAVLIITFCNSLANSTPTQIPTCQSTNFLL
jgi:hypothetical protein